MRADVVRLVRQRRYEEALALLYQALSAAPGERELVASIAQIKEFLAVSCAKRLGGLDRVAGPIPLSAATSPDAMLVARYIDGVSTFEDISRVCPLGRLRTLQVLVTLYSKAGAAPAAPPAPGEPSLSDTLPSAVAPYDPHPGDAWSPEPPSRDTLTSGPASYGARSADPPSSHVAWSAEPPSSRFARPAAPSSHDLRSAEPPSYGPRSAEPPSYGARSAEPPSYRSWSAEPPSYGRPPPASHDARPVEGWRAGQPSAYARPFDPLLESQEAPRWGHSAATQSPEDEQFRAALARGTAAFVQRRFAEAIEAFRECARLRPDDASVATMLGRSLRGLDV